MSETKIIQEGVFKIIQEATDEMINMIRPTYGPASNKVIIDKFTHRLACDDGVQIARDYESSDPAKNSVVKLIRETAIKTNDRAGDGTTGALIMLQAIIQEVSRRNKFDGRKIELELARGLEEVKEKLTVSKKEIKTKEELKKVAMVAFDNEKIAELLADTYYKLGKDGIITIDKSPTMETTVVTTEGTKIDSGYISPYMVTDPSHMQTIIEKPYILLTDYRLTEVNDIFPIIDKMAKAEKTSRHLVVIAENIEQNALATLLVNLSHVLNPETNKPGSFKLVGIACPPGNKQTTLDDLALLTGAKMFSSSKGDKLEFAEIKDLGRCERFICKREESIFVGPKGKKGDRATAVTSLRTAIENEKDASVKEELKKRLGMFTNTLAVIKVGAPTENEQKTLKYKVEDAVHAVKSAFKNGVVAGSGLALSRIETSSPILNEALKYPHRQLLENMGIDQPPILKDGEAYNVVTKKSGPFMQVGVMDPVDVLLSGVESAISIASILLTTSGIIVEYNKEDKTK